MDYRVGDTEALQFDDCSFDTVICASSIFLFKDIPKVLGEWRRVLKIGGTIAFSSFGASFAQPSRSLFQERVKKYTGQSSTIQRGMSRTDTQDKCRELIERAGFKDIEINTEQLGYYIQDVEVYWQEIISSTVNRLRLDRLRTNDRMKIKVDHFAEVESLRTDKGIWIDIPVIFSEATKLS